MNVDTPGKTWPCEDCGKPAGTREQPLFGLPDELKLCRECWAIWHGHYYLGPQADE
jgi:hypothetical protein